MLSKLPIQPAGWVVFAVGVASALGAVALGWRELLVLAVGCAAILVLSVPFVLGRSDITLERHLLPDRVTIGDPASVELHATNAGSLRSSRQIIHEEIDGRPVAVPLVALAPGDSAVSLWEPPTNRRGRYRLGPARITKADPFRLMQRDVAQIGIDEFWVQPRVVPLPAFAGGQTKDMDGPTHDHSPAGDVAFHAIRPYQTGDDSRHVHWMATARAGEMMVRHYVDNRQPYMSVLIDSNADSWASPEEFDSAIDIAASLAVSSLERSQPVSLHAGPAALLGAQRRSTRERLLDDLTLVQTDTGFDLAYAMTKIVADERHTTIAVLLTGTALSLSRLSRSTSNLAHSCAVTVVRVGDTNDEPAIAPGRGVRFVEAADVYDFARSVGQRTAVS